MSHYISVSIFLVLFGSIILIFRNKIIKIQGPSTSKYHFSEVERKRKLIIGGITGIVVGLVLLIKFLLL